MSGKLRPKLFAFIDGLTGPAPLQELADLCAERDLTPG